MCLWTDLILGLGSLTKVFSRVNDNGWEETVIYSTAIKLRLKIQIGI